MLSVPARYSLSVDVDRLLVVAEGHWTVETVASINDELAADFTRLTYTTVAYDLSAVEALDTAGAYILTRAIRMETMCDTHDWQLDGASPGHKVLMEVAAASQPCTPPPQTRQFRDTLERIGRATSRFWDELYATIAFLGEFFAVLARVVVQPRRLRIKSTVALMEEVGLDAAPIVAILSFAIGAVIAYMGANLLGALGFSVFMVDLVGFAMLRELAVVITAILIAGRSASAFTAQIGAMKMRQEIDAMTVMGLDTMETLVVPRAIACLLTIPILTFLAMMSGVFGGLIVAWVTPVQISPLLFLSRLQEMVGLQHFWVGMVKAPFFAIVIAIIGCRQGLAVSGSVDSLGSRVTTSVVQAIFAVILIDALFAVLFYQIGV